jgi:hypothetical protein
MESSLYGTRIPSSVTSMGTCMLHKVGLIMKCKSADFLRIARNVDHFFFLDVDELEATTPLRLQSQAQGLADRVHAMGRIADTNLQQELHKDFNDMPKLSKIKMEDYAVVHVSPSVIPTYLPGIRVFRWVFCYVFEVRTDAHNSSHVATTSRVSNWMTTSTRVVWMV